MNFGDLVYSLFNSKTNSIGQENSISISHGKQYKSYKNSNIQKTQGNDIKIINNYGNDIEGFTGMMGPTSVNTKNQNEQTQLEENEDELNRKISSYASSHRNLMEKSQSYLQNDNRKYGKNIYALEPAKLEDIKPSWVGCYKTKNDGLVEQNDMGNNNTVSTCKVRASDLGYSTFSLRKDGNNGTKCYVGNNIDQAQSSGLATLPVVSYAFSKSEGANIGGLLMNGQIGVYQDNITTNLQTDLTPVKNCDMSIGGKINTNNTVSTFGYNCNGTAESIFKPPPPQQVPEIPTPSGYTKYNGKDSPGYSYRAPDGTPISKLAEICNKDNCSGFTSIGVIKPYIVPQSRWVDLKINGKPVDLYVKDKITINIDTSKQYRLKHINSGNCLYNNSDGRFSTFKCIDFNDQYWTIEPVPGEKNTFMFKGVNSQYSLYADTNGQFSTSISDINNQTQHWELFPISGLTDTYRFHNIKTRMCMSNSPNGGLSTYYCSDYNDQYWKLIPITEGPKKCDQYKDTDKNLPNDCLQQIWRESGCTTNIEKVFGSEQQSFWNKRAKSEVKTDMQAWATLKDEEHQSRCYAPVPVIKVGASINTESLWSKPWVLINDGTNGNSIGQINDGSIAVTNSGGITYTRANLSVPWNSYSTNILIKSYIQLQDGRYIGVGRNDNKLYIKNKLTDNWNGYNKSSVTNKNPVRYIKISYPSTYSGSLCIQISQLAVYSNGVNIAPGKTVFAPNIYSTDSKATNAIDGTLTSKSYPDIYHSNCSRESYWQLDLGKEYDVDRIVYYNRRDCCSDRANGMLMQIFDNNMNQTPFIQGNFNLNSDMTQTIILNNTQTPPDPSTCCVTSIVQLNNGTIIGSGTDYYLYKKVSLFNNWEKIKCPSACCVTFISTLSDGNTIVGVGTNGYIYTREEGKVWILVDTSMRMSAVTQLKDGTILGLNTSGSLFKK